MVYSGQSIIFKESDMVGWDNNQYVLSFLSQSYGNRMDSELMTITPTLVQWLSAKVCSCSSQHTIVNDWSNTLVVLIVGNFAAYTFAPAILVTPLGALSVIIGSVSLAFAQRSLLGSWFKFLYSTAYRYYTDIAIDYNILSAILASFLLDEKLGRIGICGCISCIVSRFWTWSQSALCSAVSRACTIREITNVSCPTLFDRLDPLSSSCTPQQIQKWIPWRRSWAMLRVQVYPYYIPHFW